MFVIINSTPTRINKSHLVDLYEKVSWAAPDRKFAARLVDKLYSEGDSPLRYRINRLGGRSQRDKWILQAELFNELHRWVRTDWRKIQVTGGSARNLDTWGKDNYMVTKPVTLKAMIRVCTALAREDAEPAEGRQQRWEERLLPWGDLVREFREEGFYERFAAKGEVERVARVQKDLARAAGIEVRKS
jgi:hypothetical protein